MYKKLFEISYRLTLLDSSYLETKTYVSGDDADTALNKLERWRSSIEPKFTLIEVFDVQQITYVVV